MLSRVWQEKAPSDGRKGGVGDKVHIGECFSIAFNPMMNNITVMTKSTIGAIAVNLPDIAKKNVTIAAKYIKKSINNNILTQNGIFQPPFQ